MKIPFRHAGRAGTIRVRYGRSKNSAESGFDFLGEPYSRIDPTGFPIVRASIEYAGTGYRRFFAWIQIVDHDFGNKGRESVVDLPPSLIGFGLPFAAYGECPTLFDSPGTTNIRLGSFAAQAFLCEASMVDRKKPIRPLAGFAWGYDIDLNGIIRPHAPTKLPGNAWKSRLPLLKKTCPRWRYAVRP